MHATLNRVSLVTELDIPYVEPDPRHFEDPAHFDPELSRVLLHESTHYWQQLSSLWLLVMAGEDWHRLQRFVASGTTDDPAPMRAEFVRENPSAGYSIRDLVECTSRYWDIQNTGPHNLIDAEMAKGLNVDARHRETYNTIVTAGQFRSPDDGYSPETMSLAMRMAGGSYARPYILVEQRLGTNFGMILFPLVAHWALQSTDPVRMFDQFTLHAGTEVARSYVWRKRLRFWKKDEPVRLREQGQYQDELYLKLGPSIRQVARGAGSPLRTAGEALPYTQLANHPVYSWAAGWIGEAGRAALADGLGNDVKRQYRGKDAQAWVVADRLFALPGNPGRAYLYRYLQPPIHRFSDEKTWFTNVEPRHEENEWVAQQCMGIHTEWENFRRARRGY